MAASSIESSSRTNVSVQSGVRTTCDNCMRSKVRCSKNHPSCHRCLSQGVACVYSPSRKSRKVIEYRDATQQAGSTVKGAADFSDVLSSSNERDKNAAAPLGDDGISPPDVFSSAIDRAYPSPGSLFGNDGDMQGSVAGLEGMEGITQPAGHLTAYQNKSLDFSTQQWSCSMESSTLEALVPISTATNPEFISSLFPSSGDTFSSNVLDTPRETSIFGIDAVDDGGSKPGCAWIAASVLQSLDSPGAPLKRNSQPTSSTTQGKLLRNLDTVIGTNKSVMERLRRISGCTCSVPGNHLVIISAVLFMVLAWYEACLDGDRASEQGGINAGSGDLGVSEMSCGDADIYEVEAETFRRKDSLGTGTDDYAELVHIPPVQVGSLMVGVESRRHLVARIVLTELAEMTKVIESLTERSCGSSSPTCGVSGYQELEAQLQFSLRTALQTRLEKISQAAGKTSK